MAEVNLRECPFCGASAAIIADEHHRCFHIQCQGCSVTMRVESDVYAAGIWNTRAPAPREDGWRPIETQPPTEADGLFLAFVPQCILGCALVEDGKIVWPREGYSEEADGVTHWRPLPAPPSVREGE